MGQEMVYRLLASVDPGEKSRRPSHPEQNNYDRHQRGKTEGKPVNSMKLDQSLLKVSVSIESYSQGLFSRRIIRIDP